MMLKFIRNCRQHNISLEGLFKAYRDNDTDSVAFLLRFKSYALGYAILKDDYHHTDDMIETGYSRKDVRDIAWGTFE